MYWNRDWDFIARKITEIRARKRTKKKSLNYNYNFFFQIGFKALKKLINQKPL